MKKTVIITIFLIFLLIAPQVSAFSLFDMFKRPAEKVCIPDQKIEDMITRYNNTYVTQGTLDLTEIREITLEIRDKGCRYAYTAKIEDKKITITEGNGAEIKAGTTYKNLIEAEQAIKDKDFLKLIHCGLKTKIRPLSAKWELLNIVQAWL
ncbi:MAG: hypothetical protein U9P44_01205 [archaeon]|nr:hypothetical protein [archaeon]